MYVDARGKILAGPVAWNSVVSRTVGSNIQIGTTRNDILNLINGETGRGGAGDDSYNLWGPQANVSEKAGEGIDTVYIQYWGKATLSDNVENMILVSKGAIAGTGNALGNLIVAGTSGAMLNGKGGNDVLVGGVGADVFVVEKGNGSDAIVNFQPGADAILLQGYGFTSFDQITAAARQSGADVTVALGHGETLVIRDMSLGNLHAADFGMLEKNQQLGSSDDSKLYNYDWQKGVFDPTPITLAGAGKGWNANGWYVLNNMWGSSNLKEGSDYVINSTFSRGDMTKGVTFNWSVPYTTEATQIRGYPEVAFGVSPKGNYKGDPTDKAAVFPVKVADLTSLLAKYDVSWSGTTTGFNVSYDIWLTNKPNGDASTISNEIMVWVHKGAFGAPGQAIGTIAIDGVNATIYHTGTYTAVILDQDLPSGTVDVTAIIAKLQALGIVNANEYLASVELGAEMNSGVGSLTINNLDLTVVSRGADGGLVTKEVTGAGTTVSQEAPPPLLAQTAGVENYLDAHGVVVGTKVTRLDANDKATVQFYDKASKLVGYDLIRSDATGAVITQHFTALGAATGFEVFKVASDRTSTDHYDANGKFTGSETVKSSPDGTVSTFHYDAAWKLASIDTVKAAATGTTTSHYDANWKLLTFDTAKTNADGSVSNYHYDGAGKLLAVDVVTVTGGKTTTSHYTGSWVLIGNDTKTVDAAGNVTNQHFDKNWKILSAETSVANADGTVTTTHYSGAKFTVTGYDVDSRDANGVLTTTHYDSKWQVASVDHQGSAAADTMTGGANPTDLHGGGGSDVLIGGGGKTGFWFDTAIGNGDVDNLSKFSVAKDGIYLSQTIFSGIRNLGDLSASAFAVGNAATTADTRIIFDRTSGNLFYDADGNGAGAAVLFAHVDADKALTAANFHVV